MNKIEERDMRKYLELNKKDNFITELHEELIRERQIINEKIKEIERLNKIISKYDKELSHKNKQYEYLRHSESNEIKRLHTIISVVREFIITNMGYYSERLEFQEYTERYVKDLNKIINLLDNGV